MSGLFDEEESDSAFSDICEGPRPVELSFATSAATASSAAAAASSASPLPLATTDSTCSQATPLSVRVAASISSLIDGDLGFAASTTGFLWFSGSSTTASMESMYELFGVPGE
ncbi:hypothetical protein PG985_012733 [Apiospora marii]|uniref:Uncharacterized protein n=1 Tax=Apiospora marii TaxID=335849 RepID=A0ABR1RCG2_9PEZI